MVPTPGPSDARVRFALDSRRRVGRSREARPPVGSRQTVGYLLTDCRASAGLFEGAIPELAERRISPVALCLAWRDGFVAIAAVYRPRNPEENPVYGIVARHLETFLARHRERDRHVQAFVEREFREFLQCGVLTRGFLRVHCRPLSNILV